MEFALLFRYAQFLFSAESRTSGMLLFYNDFEPWSMCHRLWPTLCRSWIKFIILKAKAKVTQTLNPFKAKLESIKDAYRNYPRTDSSGNLWVPTSDSSDNQSSSDQDSRSSPTDPPKPSKEDIHRKIQQALLMKEHSGRDSDFEL